MSGRTATTSRKPTTSSRAKRRPRRPELAPQDQPGCGHSAQIASVTAIGTSKSPLLKLPSPTTMPAERTHERDEGGAGREPVERLERRQLEPQQPGVALLEATLLPEVEAREAGGERQPGEAREHQPDVEREQPAGRVRGRDAGAAAGPRGNEQRDGKRHHREAEHPVARRAAPDQVGADDEPDEEVQRACPGAPGEAVAVEHLRDQQRRLGEPADAHAPDAEPGRIPRAAIGAGVGDRRLAVADQRRPDEQLSHRSGDRAPARRARPSRARGEPAWWR